YPLSSRSGNAKAGIQQAKHRRIISCRIKMADTATNRATVANLDIPNMPCGFGEKTAPSLEDCRPFHRPMAGQRTDRYLTSLLANIREVVQAVQADEVSRRGEPQVEQWDQRLSPGQELSLFSKLGEERARGIKGGRGVEGKGAPDHSLLFPFAS